MKKVIKSMAAAVRRHREKAKKSPKMLSSGGSVNFQEASTQTL
jgi:hypothetical protein